MLKEFNIDQTPLSLNSLLINLAIGVIVSILIKIHYRRFGSTITNREEFSNIFPFILLTTILIITVVKSSLALSLGLVGALSIVRFRTPIKEPEELVYLFLAIAIGLGYAAGQAFITSILVLSILTIIFFFLSNKSISNVSEYNLIINWRKDSVSIQNLMDELKPFVHSIKLIRLDSSSDDSTATIMVSPNDNKFIDAITDKVQTLDDKSTISFFESRTNW